MSSSLKELGILFGSAEEIQEYGLAFYAANCMNNQFLSPANTKKNPEQLKHCGVYQLMRTANYKDAILYADKEAVHPTFVKFVESLGLWHYIIDKQGPTTHTDEKKRIDKLLNDTVGVQQLNKDINNIIRTKPPTYRYLILTELNRYFDTKFSMSNSATNTFVNELANGNTTITPDISQIILRQLRLDNSDSKMADYNKRFSVGTNTFDNIKTELENLYFICKRLLEIYLSKHAETKEVLKNTINILDKDGNPGNLRLLQNFVECFSQIADNSNVRETYNEDNVDKKFNKTLDAAKAFRINFNKIYTDSGSITYFENIIPYLPSDVKVNNETTRRSENQKSNYLREIYNNAYTFFLPNVTLNLSEEELKKIINFSQIDLEKYVTNTAESALRSVSDKLSGTFKDDKELDVLINLAAEQPRDLLFKLENGKLVNMDSTTVNDVTTAKLAAGLKDTDATKVAEYMSRCILSDDSKGLETCLEYINEPNFFTTITAKEIHPTLAKEVLKKFKFGRHSRTNQPESYENWKRRMSEEPRMKSIVEAIEKNTNLVAYLKAMLKLVSDNLAIIGVPQKSTSVSGSNDVVVRNLEDKIPMYKNVSVGLNGTGDVASAEMMMRGNALFNASFSMAPYAYAQMGMLGGRRRHVQKGGAGPSNLTASTLENYFNTTISSLLRKNNVTISTSDQETINSLLANLKKQELKVEKLINIIAVLNELYSFAEKTGNLEKSMDIGAILSADSKVIDYITTRKDEAQKCLKSATSQTSAMTDDLCRLTSDLAKKVFKPITNGSVNGDIILF